MFTTMIHSRWIRPDSTLSSSRHDKQAWMVGKSGLKQLLLMLVGFIYLLWQWQVMQRKRCSATAACNRWIVVVLMQLKSRSERVGLYRNEQGGFACLALLKITLSLHQCHWSQRQRSFYREGTTPATERESTINAMQQYDAWSWHGNMLWFELMHLAMI